MTEREGKLADGKRAFEVGRRWNNEDISEEDTVFFKTAILRLAGFLSNDPNSPNYATPQVMKELLERYAMCVDPWGETDSRMSVHVVVRESMKLAQSLVLTRHGVCTLEFDD